MDAAFQALVPRQEKRRQGRVEKLSFSGAVVRADPLPALGTILELRLPVGDQPGGMRLFAEVKWLDPSDEGEGCFGVLFLLPTTGRMLDLLDLHLSPEN